MPGSSLAAQPEHETISVKRMTVLLSINSIDRAMFAERRTGVILLSIRTQSRKDRPLVKGESAMRANSLLAQISLTFWLLLLTPLASFAQDADLLRHFDYDQK